MKRIILSIISFIILFSSCKKDNNNPYNTNAKGYLSVEFDNIVGSSDLLLNTGNYTNSSGENFTVTKLKYYVSNFVFTRTDGTVYIVPQDSCYFLIDESDGTEHAPLLQVPEGEYKTVQFILGIDSLRNTMDIGRRAGALDPTVQGGDMYWGWNSGYIFFKTEGTSPASADGMFMYHVGGFGGYQSKTINNIKTITLDLTQRGMPQVKAGKETNIHLMIDILKLFDGITKLSIATHPMVMFDDYSVNIANNFTAMFRHDHTEN